MAASFEYRYLGDDTNHLPMPSEEIYSSFLAELAELLHFKEVVLASS